MTSAEAPRATPDRLYRAIIATAIALGLALGLLALFGASKLELVEVPSFVVTVHGFGILAAFCIAFLALGRHRVTGDSVAYWTGIAFASYGTFAVFYVLDWPGLRGDGQSLIGHLPGTAAWLILLASVFESGLLIPAATARWPQDALAGRFWNWSVAASVAVPALISALLVTFEGSVPALVAPNGSFTLLTVAGVIPAAVLIAAAGAALATRAYRRLRSPLLAYVAIAQLAGSFAEAATVIAGHRYSLPWYLSRVVGLGGFLTVLFGLMWEYVGLYRREHDKSGQLSASAAAAERQTAELDSIVSSIADGVTVYWLDGQVLRVNDAVSRILAFGPDQAKLPWETRLRLIEPRLPSGEPLPLDAAPRFRAAAGETVADFPLIVRRGDGVDIWVSLSGAPLRGADGAVTGAVVTFRDITPLMEAQQAAQRLAAERDAVRASIGDGVVVYGLDGAVASINPAGARILGVPREVLLQAWDQRRQAVDVRLPSGEPLTPEMSASRRALQGEATEGMLLRATRGDGREIWLSMTGAPVRNASGAIIRAVVTFSDVTPLMEAQAQRDAVIATQERETTLLHLINETPDAQVLVREAGVLLRDWFGCDAVGIRWRQGEDYPYLETEGFPEDFVLKENCLCSHDDFGGSYLDTDGLPALECMCGNILRGRTDPELPFFTPGGSFWTNSTTRLSATISEADRPARTRSRCTGEGYESVALIPLRFGDTIFGLLQLNSKRTDRFTADGIVFLERMAGSLAVRLAEQEAQARAQQRAGELAESEERYRTLGELMPFGVWMSDAENRQTYVSQSFLDLLALDRQTWDSTPFASLVHPDDLPACDAMYHEIADCPLYTPWSQELRLRAGDGHWHWVLARGVKVADAQGQFAGYLGVNIDIQELKEAQQAAQGRAAEMDATLESIADGVIIYDADGYLLRTNRTMRALLQYTEEESKLPLEARLKLLDLRDTEGRLVPPRETPAARALRGETFVGYTMTMYSGSERESTSLYSGAPLLGPDGSVTGAVITVTDVTEMGRLQQETQRLADELATIIDAMPDPVVIYDREGRIVRHNPAAREVARVTVAAKGLGEVFVKHGFRHPDGTPMRQEELAGARALQGETVSAERVLFRDAEGNDIHVMSSSSPLYANGELSGAVVAWRNITELMKAQEELRRHRDELEQLVAERTAELVESETKYRQLVEGANSAIMRLDSTGEILFVNPHLEELFGYDPGELVGQPARVLVAPSPQPGKTAEAMVQDIAADPDAYSVNRNENVAKDGRRLWMLWSNRATHDKHGEVTGWLTVGTDQTAQHEAEQKLREHQERLQVLAEEARQRAEELAESESKYRELVETARSAIIQYDRDGTMTLVNEYTEELFGYEPGELLGQPVMLLVPPVDEAGRNLEGLLDEVVGDPVAYSTSENENVTKDGRRLWMVWTNRTILDERGDFAGIMCIGIDRTAQHEAEKKLLVYQNHLRQLAAELALAEQRERQRIATGLHDDISQTLVYAKMKLQQAQWVERPEDHQEGHKEVVGILDEAIRDTRDLIYQLSTPILFQEGLAEAIIWAAARASEQHGMEVAVEVCGDVRRIAEDVEVTVFQAVKELLNNARKYAPGSPVTVGVQYSDTELKVDVADGGCGFDADGLGVHGSGGFGLLNIRERLTYIRGKLEIESSPGCGTRCTIVVPTQQPIGE